MIKKLALVLAIAMVILLGWSLSGQGAHVSLIINGHEITGPIGTAVGVWKMVLATVILFCVAILLVFVFAGVGLIILACLAFVGFILAAILLPFMLPLIIPLILVWIFCVILCKRKSTKQTS